MSKISVSMSLNIEAVKGARYDRFTPVFALSDIDTDGDVEGQIVIGLEEGKKVWDAVSNFIEREAGKEVGREIKIGEEM